MKLTTSLCAACALIFTFVASAWAHFGILIPSQSMVMAKKEAALKLDVAFSHPFSGHGMPMQKPEEVFVSQGGKKTALQLKLASYLGQPAFTADYRLERPGVYQFAVKPAPYYEPAEDCLIIHYAKTIVGAFGNETGWDEPLGLPVEIIPLTRPFGNYAGNVFTGLAVKNGQPLANADVEVEFLNSKQEHVAPNPYFETQVVKTDANGIFNFGIPWAGWWGFAALAEGDAKLDYQGDAKDVELGGILWLEFFPAKVK